MDNRTEIDLTLLARYAAGDMDAFNALYEHYAPRLRERAITILNGCAPNDVDDIVQQTFGDFHMRRHKTILCVSGYLYNALQFRIARYRRFVAQQRRSPTRETPGCEVVIDDDPMVRAEKNETAQLLRSLVAELPEQERLCVEQVHMAGRSCRDYAAEINTHVNNVKRWTARGLARLRRAYNHCQPQD
jgi:RNA polymerase sigma-70 factor (ECF subfamily)